MAERTTPTAKPKGNATVISTAAAMLLAVGGIIWHFAPSNEAFADLKERVSLLEASQFTAADRRILWQVQADVTAIKDNLRALSPR